MQPSTQHRDKDGNLSTLLVQQTPQSHISPHRENVLVQIPALCVELHVPLVQNKRGFIAVSLFLFRKQTFSSFTCLTFSNIFCTFILTHFAFSLQPSVLLSNFFLVVEADATMTLPVLLILVITCTTYLLVSNSLSSSVFLILCLAHTHHLPC